MSSPVISCTKRLGPVTSDHCQVRFLVVGVGLTVNISNSRLYSCSFDRRGHLFGETGRGPSAFILGGKGTFGLA
jgi:hypothetical protein